MTTLKVTIPPASYGKYVLTVHSVSDRISRKSFSTPAALAQADNAPAGGTGVLTIWALPTPTTGRIQHVTNNSGW